MAIVDVEFSSLQADSRPKSVCLVCSQLTLNRVNSNSCTNITGIEIMITVIIVIIIIIRSYHSVT